MRNYCHNCRTRFTTGTHCPKCGEFCGEPMSFKKYVGSMSFAALFVAIAIVAIIVFFIHPLLSLLAVIAGAIIWVGFQIRGQHP